MQFMGAVGKLTSVSIGAVAILREVLTHLGLIFEEFQLGLFGAAGLPGWLVVGGRRPEH